MTKNHRAVNDRLLLYFHLMDRNIVLRVETVCLLACSFGGRDINVTQILEELKQVVKQPSMDQDSALVLNAGVHLLKSTSFRNYQKIIKGFIKLLKATYRGTVVWKTIPSLGEQTELYSGCCRRFHTEQAS